MSAQSRSPSVLVEDSPAQATQVAADLFKTIICEAVDRRGVCHLALSGGTTPHALYQCLTVPGQVGDADVPWRKVEVFFGDERDVPHDHVESNFHMAQRTLLDNVPIEPSRVHAMPADAEDLDQAAIDYERIIRRIVPAPADGVPGFDLVLLGMGGDGHVASLFPGTEALSERKKLVVAQHVPVLGRRRMTFTFPLLNAARNVLLLVTGPDKAGAVAKLLGEEPTAKEDLPAAGISPAEGKLVVILDAQAARLASVKPAK